MIDTLVFDLGGVIVAHDNGLLARTLAQGCADPEARQKLSDGFVHDRAYGTGERPISDLHARLQTELSYRHDYDRFLDDWCCHFALDSLMLTAFTALAARYRVMIFSNTNAPHWDYVDGLTGGLLKQHEAYLSHEIGHVKPDVIAFEFVAKSAGFDPARALFFDDRADNIQGAKAAGWNGEIFTDRAGFMTALKNYPLIPAK
jgi:putative hydrolase of the HAD superfamily